MNFTTKGAAKRGVDLPVAIDKEHVPVLQVSLSVQLLQHLDDTLETVVHVPHPHDFEVKSKALEEVVSQQVLLKRPQRMRTRERARGIFLWDIAAEIQGALTGRKRLECRTLKPLMHIWTLMAF